LATATTQSGPSIIIIPWLGNRDDDESNRNDGSRSRRTRTRNNDDGGN
jgi:hypothetical protein